MSEKWQPSETGYASRKVAETRANADVKMAGIDAATRMGEAALGLMTEFVRVGVSNPVVGAASAMILSDMLQRAGLISANTENAIFGVALAVVGVTAAVDVVGEIASVTDIFGSRAAPPDPLSPSATTVVFGDSPTRAQKVASALARDIA